MAYYCIWMQTLALSENEGILALSSDCWQMKDVIVRDETEFEVRYAWLLKIELNDNSSFLNLRFSILVMTEDIIIQYL